jgi:hypothetical protein
MPRNEAFIASLRAPFGKLDTTLAEARVFSMVVGKLGLTIERLQGNTTGQMANYPSIDLMKAQGLSDSDQVLLEMIIPPQTGGIDVAETIANFRADWRRGVAQLMLDVYENPQVAMERAANAIASIPEVQAAAAAALKI